VCSFIAVEIALKQNVTREIAIIEYLDYQIPVTQLKGSKGNGYMQAVKRGWKAPPKRYGR